jgi:hypothetical protein
LGLAGGLLWLAKPRHFAVPWQGGARKACEYTHGEKNFNFAKICFLRNRQTFGFA